MAGEGSRLAGVEAALRGVADIAGAPLPRRPRLASWLAFVELGDGRLQLRAVDFAFTIPEPFLADVVRHLRPLLDGCHLVEELAASGGTTFLPGTIVFVLKLLRQRGVLQEGEAPAGLNDEILGKYASALRFLAHHALDAEQILARLQASRVVLVGDAALRASLARSLDEVGVGQVVSREEPERAPDQDTGLLVALARTPASRFFEAVNTHCLATGLRM